MSVASMTNLAIARRDDDLGDVSPPKSATDLAKATGGKTATENSMTAALTAIAAYIPTEVLALYLAALAAVRGSVKPTSVVASAAARIGTVAKASPAESRTLVIFAAITPLFVWLVYAGRARTAGKKLPLRPNRWPIWEMFAATVAFDAWTFALPDSPYTRLSWYSVAWATFVVLAVSTALGLLAPVFQRPLKTGNPRTSVAG